MDHRFAAYNTHHHHPEQYWEQDSHLRVLAHQPYLYEHPIIHQLPIDTPGIYTVGGGRQIGKTTLLKQWIALLLQEGVPPNTIFFFTGELIDDHHALVELLRDITTEADNQRLYLILDEITYIKNWDKGIKFAADAGYLHNSVVILTGSDLSLMQAARMTFPGRRGNADQVDFHMYSLSFRECLTLKKSVDIDVLDHSQAFETTLIQKIYQAFNEYLTHGGYLTAINDMAREGRILPATLKIYSDWVRGDLYKRGKQEGYLKEILDAIIKRYNKQVTWHNITDAISIDSHKTVADYCELLASMDTLFIQLALMEDKLVGAPKKARKLTFTDPFIYHAIKQWLYPSADPNEHIKRDVKDPIVSSELVEALVSNQYHRHYPTYYIKGDKEIDLAYIHNQTFWPIEIKWRQQIRPQDLKQIKKYKRGRIFSKVYRYQLLNDLTLEPLPIALARADKTSHVKFG